MKIFNNFDTKLKNTEYNEKVKKYGKKNVILIQRDFFYWLIKGLIPIVIYIILSFIFILFLFSYKDTIDKFVIILIGIWFLLFLLFLYSKINIFIDYKMDFSILTKDEILTHKQKGILNSRYKNFPTIQLRSVYSSRTGFLGNLFGFGEIIFVTEGQQKIDTEELGEDGSGSGKIVMTYVKNPNETRKKIIELCLINKN